MTSYSLSLDPAGNKKDDLTIIYTPADNLKVWLIIEQSTSRSNNVSYERNKVIWPLARFPFTTTSGYAHQSSVNAA